MQLGTRWAVGQPVPVDLPEVVLLAVSAVESDLRTAGIDSAAWRWTLTWLERKPVLELDDGTTIHFDPIEDAATITQPQGRVDDVDDWDE